MSLSNDFANHVLTAIHKVIVSFWTRAKLELVMTLHIVPQVVVPVFVS